jgi:hypothetical protein
LKPSKKKEKIPLDQDNWKELWNSISKQLNIEILNWKIKNIKKKVELLEGKIE